MSDILSILGLEGEEFTWKNLAVCNGMPTDMFFNEYESDENVARMVDEACLSCPVMKQCIDYAVNNSEWGVWGGVYLVNGKPDTNRNSHKTEQTWSEVRSRIV